MKQTTISLFSCLVALAVFGGIAHFADAGGAGTGNQWTGSPYQNTSLGTYQPTTTVSGDATWSTTLTGVHLAYAWNRWTLSGKHPECFSGQTGNFSSDTMNSTCVSGFVEAGSNIAVTINQEARIYDATTGAAISNNATLQPGQTLRLEFKKLVPENIQWFVTGSSLDSPYGEWRTSAAAPPRVYSSNGGISANHVTCNIRDYANSIDIQDTSRHEGCMEQLRENAANAGFACKTYGTDGAGNQVCDEYWYYYGGQLMYKATADNFCNSNGYTAGSQFKFDVYAPLEINPPTRTLTTGGLTCTSAAADSDSDLAWTCTVPNSPGTTLSPKFNYSSTYGYFYYRYYDYRNMNYSGESGSNADNYGTAGCYGNNIALYKIRDNVVNDPNYNPVNEYGLHVGDVESSPYQLTVPAMNVPFTFTVATPNSPPTAPTITGPTTGTTATNYTFTLTSTDPDNDTIRYGVDWNSDGTLDQWVPASGYVTSGTSQNAVKQWASTGSVTFKALAQDSNGNNSGWTSYTITIQSLPDLTVTSVGPVSATAGVPVTLTATIANIGAGSTGTGFTDLFQRATDASGANATDIGTYASGALAGNSSNTATLSYTFPASGTDTTWYVRVCADKSSAGNAGVITESNENNNCAGASGGNWTQVTVGGVNLTCSASPTTITAPANSTWTASPSNLGTYTWAPSEGGSVSTASNTYTRTYSTKGQYGMSVTAGGQTAACTNYVTAGPICTSPSVSITASPDRVVGDGTHRATLTITGTGIGSACTITGPGTSFPQNPAPPANSCNLSTTITTDPITAQSTYTVTCGTASDSVIVNVIPKFEEF
ncbi:MAG: CARDB domain-containing protein [Bacillota bacterium]